MHEQKMSIFLSWRGSTSHGLAEILRRWLRTVLSDTRPWLSSEDIQKGKSWGSELTKQLEATSYCIVCITTPQVARSPWVNFEAGAISKYVRHAHVSPLLIRAAPEDLSGLPLAQYQCTRFDIEDVGRLLQSINMVANSPIDEAVLKLKLHKNWRQLKKDVDQLDWEGEPSSPDDDDESYNDSKESDVLLLDDTEEDILLLVAQSNPSDDPFVINFGHVCNHVQENTIRVGHHLDNLVRAGLLSGGASFGYTVTAEGRAYLVENEIV